MMSVRSGYTFSKLNMLKVRQSLNLVRNATTSSSSRSAETIFIEKTLEQPIIAVTEKDNVDMIGPADPVSNLRPILRKRCLRETDLQQHLRHLQDETQAWNQTFWAEHNTRFIKERKEYVQRKQSESGGNVALTADEMSEFYKKFLDEHWKTHVTYNFQWYKRNFALLFLSLKASLPPSLHHLIM